ncbi:uncharacterized protein EI90DRAFT_3144960 [Cantharellus anzutake]|uniref:uncharacterized protein n=1 Tax=Cantharellus anzutake TaxID=1750568 RepID=UPI001905F87D|nr:uncharacterized protein EI90DRAFT_3144960 [Cantharellus anzutake]KAF8335069.1 hypothetical protein EI90DRAFT_3144960 [Cantharellus anzutake]
MFAPKSLFSSLPCPESSLCSRNPCPFSHKAMDELPKSVSLVSSLLEFKPVAVPPVDSRPNQRTASSTTRTADTIPNSASIGTLSRKRGADDVPASSSRGTIEPPNKVQRVTTSYPTTSSGTPKITANPARSKIAINQRQAMLNLLYDTFRHLYMRILASSPSLPGKHAIAQEEEIYAKTSQKTYRNERTFSLAIISAVSSIQKRPPPDSKFHPSIGTIAECAERQEKGASATPIEILPSHLSTVLLSRRDMETMGYLLDVPLEGKLPEVGGTVMCERCKRLEGSQGCDRGPHVFNEKDTEALHSRHPFISLSSETITNDKEDILEVCSIDCEMIYTTAGMSCARVTMVDGKGELILDELVRMNEGVHVLFSGITSLDKAVYDLDHIRAALRSYIGPDTIIIGHALENDLKALRLVHHRIVDTSAIYAHSSGLPYRRSLRNLAKVYLDRTIQSGDGSTGHSSLEDARATLDL